MLLMRFVMFSNSRKGFHRISVFIFIFGRCGCLTAIPSTGAGFRSFVCEGCLDGPRSQAQQTAILEPSQWGDARSLATSHPLVFLSIFTRLHADTHYD